MQFWVLGRLFSGWLKFEITPWPWFSKWTNTLLVWQFKSIISFIARSVSGCKKGPLKICFIYKSVGYVWICPLRITWPQWWRVETNTHWHFIWFTIGFTMVSTKSHIVYMCWNIIPPSSIHFEKSLCWCPHVSKLLQLILRSLNLDTCKWSYFRHFLLKIFIINYITSLYIKKY